MASKFTSRLLKIAAGVGQHSDLALVGLSVVVIALMVLPMPLVVLDAFIAANITFSIALLLYGIYMSSSVAFSTFPSLLLITTLLRISLNVATTRQILLNANAGEIIATFGKLVVGGSLIVGIVIFIIITVVQFIVVAKGAERVAEVIARFTLDAIPGKQMSIDSDLRAGLISEEEARRRRRDVENESRFFGAMDGAMKFVKGDAIAAIVIVLVNLIGGMAIGILVHDLNASVALQRYAVLSIGEGLAAQIPALFIALAAGVIVTRSSSGDGGPLAGAITAQILSQPRAMILTGFVVSLFALVPGFPRFTFMALGLSIAGIGGFIMVRSRKAVDSHSPGVASMSREGSIDLHPIIDEAVPPTFAVLLIELSPDAVDLLSREELDAGLLRLRRTLSLGLGLPFPGVRIRVNQDLASLHYVISVLEVPTARGSLRSESVLAFASAEALDKLRLTYHKDPTSFVGEGVHWVGQQNLSMLRQKGIDYWTATGMLVYHLDAIIQLYPHRLLGVQDIQALVLACGKQYPDLVREAMKVIPLPRLTKVMKGLASEGISLRNMRDILQVALESAGMEKDDEVVIERIRMALSSAITFRFTQGDSKIDAYVIEPSTEEVLRKSITMSGAGAVVALSPSSAKALIDQIKQAVMSYKQTGVRDQVPVLTAADLRRPLRKLIETDLPWLAVISHDEVATGVSVEPVAVIRGA